MKDELVEMDGATTSVSRTNYSQSFAGVRSGQRHAGPASKFVKPKAKAGRTQSQHGRMLVMTGRFSKKTLLKPLPSKTQKKGAPGGTETAKEVLPHVDKHFNKDSVVGCSDSGTGLTASWRSSDIPHVVARHCMDEFTPTKALKLKAIVPIMTQLLGTILDLLNLYNNPKSLEALKLAVGACSLRFNPRTRRYAALRPHPGAANHDSVQVRPHPCPQSIHVPAMITSRSDPIHARRASMCSHDNVQIRPHPCSQSIHVPTLIPSRSDPIHARTASMCPP